MTRREGRHILDLVKKYAPATHDPLTEDLTVQFALLLAEKDRLITYLTLERCHWRDLVSRADRMQFPFEPQEIP